MTVLDLFGIVLAVGLVATSVWWTWREFREPDEWQAIREWSAGQDAARRLGRRG
jgi:hypothetical protein